MLSTIKSFLSILAKICITCLTAVVLLFLATTIIDGHTRFHFYTVQSGSMTPTFPVGTLLLVETAPTYKVGDIITFKAADEVITHRISAVIGSSFQTKGDANAAPDDELRPATNVIGKVRYNLPWLGKLFNFTHTFTGYIVLILLPAVIFILREIHYIGKELEKRNKNKTSSATLSLLLVFLAWGACRPTMTGAYFSSTVSSHPFSFQASSNSLANIQQNSAGNIDYAHGPDEGDTLQGYFNGLYQVELSNEGVTTLGSKNNGLFVSRENDADLTPPRFDPNLTLLNGLPIVNYMVGDLPEVQAGANPLRFTIRLNEVQNIKLGRLDTDYQDGDSGNVFVKLQYLGK